MASRSREVRLARTPVLRGQRGEGRNGRLVRDEGGHAMFKRVDTPFCAIDLLGIRRPLYVAALCLSMASFALAEQQSSRTAHAAPRAQEESVLIATREAPPDAPRSESSPHDIVPGTPGEEEVCEVPPTVS